jgi:hypothetical protein
MSEGDVERIMELANCSEEVARDAYGKTHDVVDSIDMILEIPPTKGAPKVKVLSEEQKQKTKIRESMEAMDRSLDTNLMKSNQLGSSFPALSRTLSLSQEEMSLRSDCIQSSQIPVQEEGGQKPETACQ